MKRNWWHCLKMEISSDLSRIASNSMEESASCSFMWEKLLLENKIRMNGEKTVFSCKTKKTKHSTSPWFHFNLLTLSKWMHAATAAIQKLQTYKHDYKHAWLETISTFFSSSFYICFAVYISHQTHTIHFIQVAVQAVDACINLSIFLTLEYIDVRIVLLNSLFSQRFRWFSLSSSAD